MNQYHPSYPYPRGGETKPYFVFNPKNKKLSNSKDKRLLFLDKIHTYPLSCSVLIHYVGRPHRHVVRAWFHHPYSNHRVPFGWRGGLSPALTVHCSTGDQDLTKGDSGGDANYALLRSLSSKSPLIWSATQTSVSLARKGREKLQFLFILISFSSYSQYYSLLSAGRRHFPLASLRINPPGSSSLPVHLHSVISSLFFFLLISLLPGSNDCYVSSIGRRHGPLPPRFLRPPETPPPIPADLSQVRRVTFSSTVPLHLFASLDLAEPARERCVDGE